MKTKKRTFNQRVIDAVIKADAVRLNQPRVVRACKRVKALEGVLYTWEDLRGLSIAEKRYMIDNNYRCFYDCCGRRYYIFIQRNQTTGKRQLYAYEKKQYLTPNGHDVAGGLHAWNYECWLTVNTRTGEISRLNYERRFSNNILPPLWLDLGFLRG